MARRYRLNFPWLSCWLRERKRKYVEQIVCLERSFFLVSHDLLALNLDGYFFAPLFVISCWRGARECSDMIRIY